MNFEPSDDQTMIAETFSRFLDEHSSMARVRAALPTGFDKALWTGLAELGALAMRVPEEAGGLGLGLFDAVLLMEQAGRTLVSGPLAETIVAARVLGILNGDSDLQAKIASGEAVASIAFSRCRVAALAADCRGRGRRGGHCPRWQQHHPRGPDRRRAQP